MCLRTHQPRQAASLNFKTGASLWRKGRSWDDDVTSITNARDALIQNSSVIFLDVMVRACVRTHVRMIRYSDERPGSRRLHSWIQRTGWLVGCAFVHLRVRAYVRQLLRVGGYLGAYA